MAAKGERELTLRGYEAEYAARLKCEAKHEAKHGEPSPFLAYLRKSARMKSYDFFYSKELKGRDKNTRRLFTLQGKIHALRHKLGLIPSDFIDAETPYLPVAPVKPSPSKPKDRPRFYTDPAPPGFFYPVSFDEIHTLLAELPQEHTYTVYEIRLSSQRKGSIGGDWCGGRIRLHCLVSEGKPGDNGNPTIRRPMGKREYRGDLERWGGHLEWEGRKLFAVWPRDAYKSFVLRRVLVHEIAHGVANLRGYSEKVRRAGSVEKFCEQYAESFYRPPGKSVRSPF